MGTQVRKAEGRNPARCARATARPRAEKRPKPEIRRTAEGARNARRPQAISSNGEANRPGIQAVTFDVGGTLIECQPSVGHIYAEVAARHGYRVSAAALNRRFKAAWRAFSGFHHTRVRGACAAGLQAVRLRRGGKARAAAELDSLRELYKL